MTIWKPIFSKGIDQPKICFESVFRQLTARLLAVPKPGGSLKEALPIVSHLSKPTAEASLRIRFQGASYPKANGEISKLLH